MSKKKHIHQARPEKESIPVKNQVKVDESAQSPVMSAPVNEAWFKNAFFISLAAMLCIFWITGFNVGYHQDEMDMNNYGKANYAYYFSGGKDTSCLGTPASEGINQVDSLLKYYGSAFEYLPVGFNKLTGAAKGNNEFNVRHMFCQLFGVIVLLFAGLIARKYGGWRAAFITAWLLFLTPVFFGHTLFNSKDIPFCAGYIASLYFMICFLQELPEASWKSTLGLMVSFAFTTGTRIGGFLLLFYLFLFVAVYVATNLKSYKPLVPKLMPIAIKLCTIVFGGLVLLIATWPYVLRSPLKNLANTLTIVKRFPVKVTLAFEGNFMDSLSIPTHYIPKFMLITIPIFILIVIISGLILVFLKNKQYDFNITSLILFSSIFPIVYAIMTNAALYSAWRHFLFIYPGLCIIGAIGANDLLENFRKPAMKIAFGVICILGMIRPVTWMISNHPYEYTYFNEFAGGFKQAYYNYETDYWEISAKQAIDWMVKNEPILESKDTVLIASNMTRFTEYYLKKQYHWSKFKVISVGCMTRYRANWTYCIINTIFLRPEYLENYFPPCQAVHTENIDGLPVTAIIKDTERLDWAAQVAMNKEKYQQADSILTIYLQKSCPNNPSLYGVYSLIKADLNQYADAIKYGNLCLSYNISPYSYYDAHCGLGVAYANNKEFDSSLSHLSIAIKMFPDLPAAGNIIKLVNNYKHSLQATGGK